MARIANSKRPKAKWKTLFLSAATFLLAMAVAKRLGISLDEALVILNP
jgi:hypothetical protein